MLLVRPNGGTQSDDQRSNLHMALQCAVDVQKRKVLYGPQDSVGILLYNTVRRLSFHAYGSLRSIGLLGRSEYRRGEGEYLSFPASLSDKCGQHQSLASFIEWCGTFYPNPFF